MMRRGSKSDSLRVDEISGNVVVVCKICGGVRDDERWCIRFGAMKSDAPVYRRRCEGNKCSAELEVIKRIDEIL
jgi:hypothetical protein